MAGTLYLVGTPIGNLGDITLRALETLKAVDAIAAEDTRESQKLLGHYGISKPLVSYHDHNQRFRGPQLVERLLLGESLALISDAGMPGISDPGEQLVVLAIEAGVTVVPIPGPTALATALVVSGLPTGRFAFEGFMPREPKGRRRRLRELERERRTMVFYEGPHRVTDTLADMIGVWGPDRPAVAGRELTKRFEEIRRGSLGTLAAYFAETAPRGEFVLLVAGSDEPDGPAETGDWGAALGAAIANGTRPADAAKAIAKAYGLSRHEVYDAAVAMRDGPGNAAGEPGETAD